MSDLSSVFHSAFKNVLTECEGCKHYEKHIEMIARESKEPCKYCSRHYYDKFEEDRRMTREEAIQILRDTPIDIRSTREDDILTLYATAHMMAIEALSAEPIERISDNTIVVNYADYEDIGRIILTNGDIFCKMFYEDNTQEDDDNYDSLIPDEYKTDGDLISRADAIEAIDKLPTKDTPIEFYEVYRMAINDAEWTIDALPSAEAVQRGW